MAHLCIEHPYEQAEGLCRKCGAPYCADCLLYPFGPAKPPYCVPCAVNAGGVRKTAGNPTRVEPKENKRRLKEWGKARKRDLDSPPPDGVATWQRMDEAAAVDQEVADEARVAAEREALRLPPPVPETPTPPPGVNLAPPGPPGQDWRDEIDVPVATNFGPPGSSFDHGGPSETPLLGYAPPEDDAPLPDFGPLPAPEAESVGVDIGFGDPDPRFGMPAPVGEPTPLATTFPAAYEPSPYDTGRVTTDGELSSFGFEDPMTPPPVVDPPVPVFEMPSFEPAPFEPEPAVAAPVAFEPDADPLAAAFGAAPTPAAPAAEPLAAFGLGADDGFTPPAMAFDDDPMPPPPPVDVAPAPPVAAPEPPPMPVVAAMPAPIPAPVVDATPATREAAPAPQMPEPAAAPGAFADIPRSAIRPPTPTRIPAAKPEQGKTGDAKAMLARIAALRSDKE